MSEAEDAEAVLAEIEHEIDPSQLWPEKMRRRKAQAALFAAKSFHEKALLKRMMEWKHYIGSTTFQTFKAELVKQFARDLGYGYIGDEIDGRSSERVESKASRSGM